MTTEKMRKMPKQFYCEKCDFKCYKRSNFDIHLGTAKHKKQQLTTNETHKQLECICGKKYKERTALYRHKKKCTYKTQEELLAETMKQQLEEQLKLLQEQIKEQSMWRTLYPSIKKDNGVGHCGRKRSLSI